MSHKGVWKGDVIETEEFLGKGCLPKEVLDSTIKENVKALLEQERKEEARECAAEIERN